MYNVQKDKKATCTTEHQSTQMTEPSPHIISCVSPPTGCNDRYKLVVKQQPQTWLMSGFGANDHRPIEPAPVVELFIYDDNGQLIDLSEFHYPPCLLHVSLWSKDRTQQLDTVQITSPILLRVSSSATSPLRTMTGTLASSPKVIRNHQRLGLYFSFPDIGFRVTETYCLRFDLVILSGSIPSAESTAHVYSDPFVVKATKRCLGQSYLL